MSTARVEVSPWARPRRRAEVLRERYSFAGDVLTLYLALVDVWDEAWAEARAVEPRPLAHWAAERVLPRVVSATAEAGPRPLAEALLAYPVDDVDAATELLASWLAGAGLDPVPRYLARACTRGPLAAVDADAACAADPAPRGDRRCPRCGGQPQLSFRTDTGDRLASGGRRLLCSRCGETWAYTVGACPSCGESRGEQRTFYSEHREGSPVGRREDESATLPHLRLEGCSSCGRYLVDVDVGRDPMAVPEVDELVALPLDLYAAERGMAKVTPNLMGL